MSVKTYRRGVILICAALCGALTASLNIWSIFQKPLMEAYGFSPQSVSFAYTIVIAMIGLSGPIGGWLQRKAPAHVIMTVAGIGFGLGWFLTGFASTIPVLYITFGLLVGVCDGICYNLALAIATRWYPDKRGFANGVALAIMAIYPLFTAPMGNMIIENFNVSIAFNIVGVFCIVGFIVLSRFLKMPAADFKPEGWTPPAESDTKRVKNYTSGQMLKTPFFWTLLLFFGTVACTGCVMLSTVSLVGQVQAGMDAAMGALMVGIFAIANGTGRLGLGAISDKFGRFQTMFVAVAVTAVIHLFLFANATSSADLHRGGMRAGHLLRRHHGHHAVGVRRCLRPRQRRSELRLHVHRLHDGFVHRPGDLGQRPGHYGQLQLRIPDSRHAVHRRPRALGACVDVLQEAEGQ